MHFRALNYAPKAIESMRAMDFSDWPVSEELRDLTLDLLDKAEVFLLPEGGSISGNPERNAPGIIFTPPYEVTACEYAVDEMPDAGKAASSKRIALAWDWRGQYQSSNWPFLSSLDDGFILLSVFYVDSPKQWRVHPLGAHASYENCTNADGAMQFTCLPLGAEAFDAALGEYGTHENTTRIWQSDIMAELLAYTDLGLMLACKNIKATRNSADEALNKQRTKNRRVPLKDFHILELTGARQSEGGAMYAQGDSRRAHLRRGHIRRISEDKMTWVSQCFVSGKGGFIDKMYSVDGG